MFRRLGSVIVISLLLSCSSSPTGRSQLLLIGDSQIAQMGIASFAQMKEKSPPVKDAVSTAYVTCISNALLKAAGENPAAWEVQVFNDKTPNAFALPGRKIGVHTGMFAVAKTQAQLAAVIGHEIGHVQAKHGAERVSLNMASQLGQQAAAIGLQGNKDSQLIMAAIGLGSQIGVMLPYSRTHESEADFIGLILMARAGFEPKESVQLWINMAAAGGGNPPEFLSTHPSGKTRIEKLNSKMPEANVVFQRSLAKGLAPQCKKP